MRYIAKTDEGEVWLTDYTSTLPLNISEVTLTNYRMTRTGPIARINGTWYSINGGPHRGWIETRYPLTKSELLSLR